jgi:copper chaperone
MKFIVEDMTCGHCAGTITKAVQAADPRAQVAIDLPTHEVKVESGIGADQVAAAIRQAGYTPVPRT